MIARPARGPNSDKGPAHAHDASGNSQHDHPLSCHWRPVAPDALDFLGLSPLRSKLATIARTQILTEAFVIGRADPNAWISYSRAKMFYTSRAGHRYWPTTYSYRTIVPTIDQSSAKGRLDHGWQSRFKASPELLRRLSEPPLAVVHDPRELIVLRDHDGNVIDYTDTRRTDRMRRNIQSINEAIMGAAIELRGRAIRDGDPLQVGNANVVANITERYAKSKKPNDFKAAVTEGRESKSPPPRRRGRVG